MRRGFEQENLFTLSKHATEFKNKVKKKPANSLFRELFASCDVDRGHLSSE